MRELLKAGPLLQLAWVVALSALLPVVLGLLLDHRLGTPPLFAIIGALLGILISTVSAVRIATRAIDALGRRPTDAEPPPGQAEQKED